MDKQCYTPKIIPESEYVSCSSVAGHDFEPPPDCLLDDFTRKHSRHSLSTDPSHSEVLLQAVSALTVPSIAGVECNHAYIRRQKLSLEMSHTPSVYHSSSLFVLAQFRKGLQPRAPTQVAKKRRTWKAIPKGKAGKTLGWRKQQRLRRGVEKTHGGGTWRMFVKARLEGQQFDSYSDYKAELRRLGSEYSRLKESDPETFAKLRRQGLRATVAHRNTSSKPLDSQSLEEQNLPEFLQMGESASQSPRPWSCRTSQSGSQIACHYITTDVRSLSECVMCRMPAKNESFIEDMWRQEHVLTTEAPSKLPRTPRISPCRVAGLCLHTRPHLQKMTSQLLACLQKRFPIKTRQRELLRSGQVVLELKVKNADTGRTVQTSFAHASYVQLQNPWKFTMLVLEKDDNPVQVCPRVAQQKNCGVSFQRFCFARQVPVL